MNAATQIIQFLLRAAGSLGLNIPGLQTLSTMAEGAELWRGLQEQPDALEQLARDCRRAGCAVLMALSYDGLIRWEPGLEDDVLVRRLLNRHQKGDKGFGPALGPDAWEVLVEALEREDYRVVTAPSNWQIPPDRPALQETRLRRPVAS